MSRQLRTAWIWWVLCLTLAWGTAGLGYAQENQEDPNAQSQTERESSSQSDQQEDQQQSANEGHQQAETRSEQDQDRDQSRDEQDQPGDESRTRDQFRRAPQTGDERRSDEGFSRRDREADEEQGGLGVAVLSDGGRGVRIVRVYRDTPASEMGLQPGDRITEVNGQQVQSTEDFISQVRRMDPGQEIELSLVRNNDERNVSGELESREEALELRNEQLRQQQGGEWDNGFGERRRDFFTYDRPGQQQDAMDRIAAIERQLDRLMSEVRGLRASLSRGQSDFDDRNWDRETAASYEEDRPRRGREIRPSSRPWRDEDARQFDGYEEGRSSQRSDADRSPGGETGEDRLRPSPNDINER